MASKPLVSNIHVDDLLTEISIAFRQDNDAFLVQRLPTVPMEKQSGKLRTYTRNDWARDEFERLGPGAESAGLTYGVSNDTYSCEVWAGHHDIDDQDRVNYDEPGAAEEDAVAHLTEIGMIRQERQFATDIFAASKWTGSSTGSDITVGTQWSTAATSDPGSDIDTEQTALLTNGGRAPNALIVGWETNQAVKRHPNILEQVKYTRSGADAARRGEIGAYFEVARYEVMKASYASNVEDETAAYAQIGGKHALLCYLADRPSLMTPSAFYAFVWKGLTDMNDMGMAVENIPMRWIHSDRIELKTAFDMKITAASMGSFLASVVA